MDDRLMNGQPKIPAISDPVDVTICIPTLGRPGTVRTAIRSALSNSGQGVTVRVVVSMNAPPPECRAEYAVVVREFGDVVTFVTRPQRIPPEQHFSDLIAEVNSKYVTLLADDDSHSEGFVARAVHLANSTGAALVFGPYVIRYNSGDVRVHRDYSSRRPLVRAMKFAIGHEDGCFYGLFRTQTLKGNLQYLAPYTIRGNRTLLHAVFPLLLAVIVDGGYATLGSAIPPVWINDETTVKHEAYVSGHRTGSRLVAAMLAKWARHQRYRLIVRERIGISAMLIFEVPNLLRWSWEVLNLCVTTGVSLARRRAWKRHTDPSR